MKTELGFGRRVLWVGLAVGMMVFTAPAADRASAESRPDSTALSPLKDPPQGMTGEELFSKLLEHNQLRNLRLDFYSATRTYELKDSEGKLRAQEIVLMQYRAPNTKEFTTTSEKGSRIIRSMVFKRLMESEAEAAGGREHRDSSITPVNYAFRPVGEQDIGPYHCIVVEAIPSRMDKYLFEGKIWIDAQDFAVVRIAGHPARKPSFWINRAEFVRQYQKIGDFWLPCKDQTFVDVKLYGQKVLTIDHQDYRINRSDEQAQDITREGPATVR